MKTEPHLADLEKYARAQIAAHRYPNDAHVFRVMRCKQCDIVPLELTVEHHSGSTKGSFRGIIAARCTGCGEQEQIFSFTGEHRVPVRTERPKCACGHAAFFVAECERIEREEGAFGFVDEGVVVGQCAQCGKKRPIVFTD